MYSFETPEESIIRYYNKKFSNRQIRELTRCGFDRIRNTIKYYVENGEIPPPKKIGRPTKATEIVLSFIEMKTIEDKTSTCKDISISLLNNQNIQLSKSSVQRYRHTLDFNFKPPKIKQFLNEKQIESRLIFSNSIIAHKIDTDKFVFSDESRFCRTKDGIWKWYRKDDNSDDIYDKKNKYENGIMVFGAIGFNYKSKLIVCEKTVDEIEYRRLINESGIENDLNSIYPDHSYIFMQDGAPAHTSFSTILFLKKRFNLLKMWPANSPDLNPIENLWGAIKRILKFENINTKSEFIEKVKFIWENFPQDSINNLISTFIGRLRKVIEENGQSINQFLRKGIHKFPTNVEIDPTKVVNIENLISNYDPTVDDNPVEFVSKRQFTPEEDLLLIQLVSQLGTRWTFMTRYFLYRTPGSLSRRWKYLRK